MDTAQYAKHLTGSRERTWKGVLGGVIAIWLFGSAALAANPQAAPSQIILIFAEGALTARLQGVPLHQVLDELSKQSGVQVRWLNGGGAEPVSVDFQRLPITEALQRLLPHQNFLLLYHADLLQQIWVTSGGPGEGVPIGASLANSSPLAEENQTEEEDETAALSPQQLLAQGQELALHAKSEARRADAIKWLASAGRDDPQSHATLLQLANDPTDPSMRAIAAEMLEQMP